MGYFPNAKKTWLIVKPEHANRASLLFPDINVTSEGHPYLGYFFGNLASTINFVEDKINEWKKDVDALVQIANSEPQLAYNAYVSGT